MNLASLLRERHPTVVLLSERRLRKLLALLIARGERLPFNADLPLALEAHQRNGLEQILGERELPSRIVLLTPPDDRSLFAADETVILKLYSRLLFAGELPECLRPNQCTEAWSKLTLPQQREISFVLDAEWRLPENATASEVATAFMLHLVELLEYQPDAVVSYYPLFEVRDDIATCLPPHEVRSQLVRECDLAARIDVLLAGRTSDGGGQRQKPSLARAANTTDPTDAVNAWIAKGNFVRAIVRACGTPAAERALREHLLGGLASILHWSDATVEAWHAALQPVIAAASQSRWPREKRALYDLQRLVADHSGPLDAVAPVEWLASFGRQPLRRTLEPVREVILARRLRAVEKHIERSSLSLDERHPIEALVEKEINHSDARIRAKYGPILHRIFDEVGYVPANLPERIGRDKTVAELLDRLSEAGFLRLADVRDAIARNHLKLPDCTLREFLHGDALLKADRLLHQSLYGVYHRGEIYLRGIQRFSSAAFGTPLGRWLTLFVALPFGGAFLAIEAAKHLAHAVASLAKLIWKLIEKPEIAEAAHAEHHAPAFDAATLTAIGILGTLLLLLINVRSVRTAAVSIASLFGRALRTLVVTLPRVLLTSAAAKWLFDNRVTRFLNVYLLLPGLLALAVMFVLILFGIRTDLVVALGLTSFITAALFGATRWGYELREDIAETMHDMGRRVVGEFVPGLVSWILWVFRELLGLGERGLYAIDEWFRYREGQSKPSLALKACLALLWFPFAYVLRFAFYLLLEPQVNPIKHFPVVTVSHKVLLPMIPSVASALRLSVETAGLVISLIPGIFGFLVWEFKENWRLYAANRPEKLPAAPLGHHGETMRGLLRSGFHSGTVPKLFRRFRRWFADAVRGDRPERRDKLDHELHHLHVAIERLVERDLFAYWKAISILYEHRFSIAHMQIGAQRIEIGIRMDNHNKVLWLSFENIEGTIIGSVDDWGWCENPNESTGVIVRRSLDGFFATAAARDEAWSDWLKLWN